MSNSKKINMREIAKLANVSTATISRALHNPEKVHPDTLQKILQIVEDFNYSSVQTSPSSSNIIAFFLCNTDTPYHLKVLHNLTDYAAEKGYFVVTCSTNDNPVIEQELFHYFSKIHCAGIVLTGLTTSQTINADVPVVLLDSNDSIHGNFLNICSDNKAAIELLVDYLIKLNHQKIGFISGNAINSGSQDRKTLFVDYMKSCGLELPENYVYHGHFNIRSGLEAFDYFYSLPNMPTAIIAANDEMAKGFIIRANSLGVKIPTDISICGIDALINDTFSPQITSIRQDTEAAAREIFNFILQGNTTSVQKRILLPVTFASGNTCYSL